MGKLSLLIVMLLLAGCGGIHAYDASVTSPDGRYDIVGRRGALIEVVHTDGTRITADDRGHPDQPSALSNMASVAGAALINKD